MNDVIGEVGFEDLCEIIKKQKFSIIVDESTDLSNKKSLVIVVRHLDLNGVDREDSFPVRDSFLRLIEVQQCTAEDIYRAITKLLFQEIGAPKANLIGFAADNASVMMGEQGGV